MLSIHDRGLSLCDGLSRREWLRVGGLGVCGLSLPALLASRAAGRAAGRARACIFLFHLGGPPQHETFDPKPDAPKEIRGDFKPISTSVPGIQVCELMPRTAKLVDRLAILRAVSTDDNAHSSSGYWMLTGVPHQPKNVENAKLGAPNDWPSLGAIVRRLRPGTALPSSVTIPEHIWNTGGISWPGQDGGFLGRSADPWLLHCQPQQPGFQVPALSLPGEVPPLRLDDRTSLRQQLDRHLDSIERSPALGRYDVQTRQAFDLLRAGKARNAFKLDDEPAKLRDRYGRNRWGQSVLLARRLVEAGVSLVQVNWQRMPGDTDEAPAWDTHARNNERMKSHLAPIGDQAFSALLEDLLARGLLDEVLVIFAGEFGRTPRFNPRGGRDHWGHVFSVALAGGGIKGGLVHGASDRIGGHPRDGKVQPQDLAATIFHCLGHAPDTEMRDGLGRPIPISRGEVIRPVLA